jgi:hypothetical protein
MPLQVDPPVAAAGGSTRRRDPQLNTVVNFLSALGLRLAVIPVSSELM